MLGSQLLRSISERRVVSIKGSKYNFSIVVASILMLVVILFCFSDVFGLFSVNAFIYKVLFGVITLAMIGGATASEVNYIRYISDEADLPPEFEGVVREVKDNDDIDIV